MKNSPIYKSLLQYARDNNLTIQQVENATMQQAINMLGLVGEEKQKLSFIFNGAKSLLIREEK